MAALRTKLHHLSAGENARGDGKPSETETRSEQDGAPAGGPSALTPDDDASTAEVSDFSHLLNGLLRKELDVFCAQLTSTPTEDVSQEQMTNSRHDVVGVVLESRENEETENNALAIERDGEGNGAKTAEETAATRTQMETEEFRVKLARDILQLVNSNEG